MKSSLQSTLKNESKDNSLMDYEIQSKDAIIRKLNAELNELKFKQGSIDEKQILLNNQKT